MTGIYIIRNSINNKVYIGRSTDIHRRWTTHLHDARCGENSKIHIAMRVIGIDNFYLEVLEECPVEKLNEREQYYIEKYDSWHNGYNNGNSSNFLNGENNCNAKMTKQEIENIRVEQSFMEKNRREIYEKYKDKITWTNFLFICKYQTWPDIRPDLNTEEVMSWHFKQLGNEAKKLNMEDLEEIIRLRKQEKLSYTKIGEIYHRHARTISRICDGTSYKKEIKELREKRPDLFQS